MSWEKCESDFETLQSLEEKPEDLGGSRSAQSLAQRGQGPVSPQHIAVWWLHVKTQAGTLASPWMLHAAQPPPLSASRTFHPHQQPLLLTPAPAALNAASVHTQRLLAQGRHAGFLKIPSLFWNQDVDREASLHYRAC